MIIFSLLVSCRNEYGKKGDLKAGGGGRGGRGNASLIFSAGMPYCRPIPTTMTHKA